MIRLKKYDARPEDYNFGDFFEPLDSVAEDGFFVTKKELEQREREAFEKGGEAERNFIYHGIIFEFEDYLSSKSKEGKDDEKAE